MIKTRKGNGTLSIVEFKEKVANIYQEATKNHPIKDNRGISLNALLDYYFGMKSYEEIFIERKGLGGKA